MKVGSPRPPTKNSIVQINMSCISEQASVAVISYATIPVYILESISELHI